MLMIPSIIPSSAFKSAAHRSELNKLVTKHFKHTCGACNFRDPLEMYAHPSAAGAGKYLCLCSFCVALLDLEDTGDRRLGSMVLTPEPNLNQAAINAVVHGCWIQSEFGSVSQRQESIKTLSLIEERSAAVEEKIGKGLSDPRILAEVLKGLTPKEYASRGDFLGNVYFVPARSAFEGKVNLWSKSVYKEVPPERWRELAMTFKGML